MASGPITSWQIDREKVEAVTCFLFLGSKITTDGDCSLEIKRRLLLERKGMRNLDSILKSRDITFSTKVCVVKAMVFTVLMYECESWTIKKVEHRSTVAFKLWFWRDSWESLDCKEIKPDNPKGNKLWILIHWKDWCWSSNTLATWCKEPTHWKKPLMLGKLRAGGEGGDRGWDGYIASLTQWTLNLSKLREIAKNREAWCAAAHGVTKSLPWLSDWTTITIKWAGQTF